MRGLSRRATKVLDLPQGKEVVLLEHQEVHGGPGELSPSADLSPGQGATTRDGERGPSERRPGVDQVLTACPAPASLGCRSSSSTSTARRVPRQLPVRAGRETSRVRQLRDGGMHLFVHNARSVVLPRET
jgi:hypothetical protein